MSNDYLHLDGIARFTGYLVVNHWRCDETEGGFRVYVSPSAQSDWAWAKTHIFCRIFSIFEAVVIAAFNVVKQTVRGTALLVAGLIHICDTKLIKFALSDLASAAIQAVVLPLLGIMAAISPTEAMRVSQIALKRHNPSIIADQRQCCDYEKIWMAKVLIHATATVQAVAYIIEKVITDFFTLNFSLKMLWTPLACVLLLFFALMNAENRNEIPGAKAVHGIITPKTTV